MKFEIKKCFYCGEYATEKDHIIPVSFYWSGKRKRHNRYFIKGYGKDNLIDCCRECNSIAGNKVFTYVDDKREYIQERLKTKYRKVINMPFWSDEEIKELGYNLRKDIKIQQLARVWILNRINYPIEIYSRVRLNNQIVKFMRETL